MKTVNKLALGFAALALAATGYSQTMVSGPAGSSIRDNPGVLGHSFADVNYTWVDFSRDRGVDADGFIAGLHGNTPIAPGFDVGLGYNYYRENGHRNPFTGTDFDARYHQLATNGTLFMREGAVKPFLSAGLGYQWSQGDLQSLSTYDDMWLWGASAGVEIPVGTFALTPRVSYTDGFDNNAIGVWRYGGELHTWFSERMGGYLDASYHDPKGNLRTDAWTYTAGLRFRF